jgi:hypothetical protein
MGAAVRTGLAREVRCSGSRRHANGTVVQDSLYKVPGRFGLKDQSQREGLSDSTSLLHIVPLKLPL